MVHQITRRAVISAVQTLAAPIEIGLVFPPRNGETRGRGLWPGRGLSITEIEAMLPRAAGANARGAAVFMRLAPLECDHHPGIVLLDDLTGDAVANLESEGFAPRLVVQTSPRNYQAWIALLADGDSICHATALVAARLLAARFNADPRAVSPRQPGRLPGFSNRKEQYRLPSGLFPFVTLVSATPAVVAEAGHRFVARVTQELEAQARRGAPKTERSIPGFQISHSTETFDQLEILLAKAQARIRTEWERGRRSADSASRSEVDFAVAVEALDAGVDEQQIADWLSRTRPEKASGYGTRTVEAAQKRLLSTRQIAPI